MNNSRLFSDYITSEFTAEKKHEGMRADVFLAAKADFLSRTRLKQKIQQGQSLLNGRRHSASKRVRKGDIFSVTWRRRDDRPPPPEPDILYEDTYLLAVNKPAGTAVHPTGRKQSGTIIQSVCQHYRDRILSSLENRDEKEFYPRLINRLDLFTSGIVLVAKHKDTFVKAQKLIAAGRITKRYTAVAEGLVKPAQGTVQLPLGRDEQSDIYIRQSVREDGLPSETRYHVIEWMDSCTLLHAWPVTGRQHQIRVHLAELGHPVCGDLIYKDEKLFKTYYRNGCSTEGLPARHALHAEQVDFTHPCTGEPVTVTAPVPADMKESYD